MQSRHAMILALMLGAAGLVVALGGFLTLELLGQAEPYLNGQNLASNHPENFRSVPSIITKLDGAIVKIVELNRAGQEERTIYVSNLNDQSADFSLFAVPQTQYQGLIYVQSVQDAASDHLIVYPLETATGELKPAVLNVNSVKTTLSPDQTKAATITLIPEALNIYEIATGISLKTWTLSEDQGWQDSLSATTYTGEGATWSNHDCVRHTVWTGTESEVTSFCL